MPSDSPWGRPDRPHRGSGQFDRPGSAVKLCLGPAPAGLFTLIRESRAILGPGASRNDAVLPRLEELVTQCMIRAEDGAAARSNGIGRPKAWPRRFTARVDDGHNTAHHRQSAHPARPNQWGARLQRPPSIIPRASGATQPPQPPPDRSQPSCCKCLFTARQTIASPRLSAPPRRRHHHTRPLRRGASLFLACANTWRPPGDVLPAWAETEHVV